MNLTTLEQSKNLKKWGAPQDTEFMWARQTTVGREYCIQWSEQSEYQDGDIAAYTLEELIGWLPKVIRRPHQPSVNALFTLNPKHYYDSLRYHDGIQASTGWEAGYENVVGKGDTPLEAVYELAKAIHETEKE